MNPHLVLEEYLWQQDNLRPATVTATAGPRYQLKPLGLIALPGAAISSCPAYVVRTQSKSQELPSSRCVAR
ncbi:hypothetical protein EYF80_039239 [Liparis tanakae]|uniref:Uncharacterized protein n=1 Tax=Liparis tanakae TaxID=230148 RepID=A0A4Z2GAC7_9TELE|nr:hypothetical protein EYF80_039239 [Liparis tanakae]